MSNVQQIEVEPGVRLAVSVTGSADQPAIVLCNSLATSLEMWDEVAALLASHALLVRYDTRGHGRSDAPEACYTIDRLGSDVIAILDALAIPRASVCGISLGGLTAMWLGIHAPDRVGSLILANTAANFPPEKMWRDRAALARSSGLGSFVPSTLERWVTPAYRETHGARVAELGAMILATSPIGYSGCCEVLASTDLLSDLPDISCPVAVIAGAQDPSTPPSRSEEIAAAIAGAQLHTIDAAHISAVEDPRGFADIVLRSRPVRALQDECTTAASQ